MYVKTGLCLVVVLVTAGCSSLGHRPPSESLVALQRVPSASPLVVSIASDRSVSVNGGAVPTHALAARLTELGGDGAQPITIKAHRKAPHDIVVTVMDVLVKAGCKKVSFVTTPD